LFNWKLLAEKGLGLWPKTISEYDAFRYLEDNKTIPSLITLGYEQHNQKSIIAFQRHWRQHKVDGIWDDECQQNLTYLLMNIK